MFDYFAVLVSVVFGLALTHLLRGLGKLIQMRRQCRIYLPHIIWTINVVLWVLAVWWGMFWWRSLSDWTFAWFLFIASYAIVVFVWSYMLYPQEVSEHINFEQFFHDNRRPFFGLMLLAMLMDVPEVLVKSRMGLRAVPTQYAALVVSVIVIAVIGLSTANRRTHLLLPFACLVVLCSYELLSAVRQIGAVN